MAKKFHLTEAGPKPCNATKRPCPIGGDHFSSEADAAAAFEASQDSFVALASSIHLRASMDDFTAEDRARFPASFAVAEGFSGSDPATEQLQAVSLGLIRTSQEEQAEFEREVGALPLPMRRAFLAEQQRLREGVLDAYALAFAEEGKPGESLTGFTAANPLMDREVRLHLREARETVTELARAYREARSEGKTLEWNLTHYDMELEFTSSGRARLQPSVAFRDATHETI